jgi:hypothetical protein
MTAIMQQLLETFDHLAEAEKKELAVEILRRTAWDAPELAETELIALAEEQFLALEREEEAQ